ncbi:hypothetical protein KCP73_21390 [Salmonella enterica subsp. enterica]|nr:hypothetical protein KCP73_21390 [Salmonella enterica subsp. enterica]
MVLRDVDTRGRTAAGALAAFRPAFLQRRADGHGTSSLASDKTAFLAEYTLRSNCHSNSPFGILSAGHAAAGKMSRHGRGPFVRAATCAMGTDCGMRVERQTHSDTGYRQQKKIFARGATRPWKTCTLTKRDRLATDRRARCSCRRLSLV